MIFTAGNQRKEKICHEYFEPLGNNFKFMICNWDNNHASFQKLGNKQMFWNKAPSLE